MKTFWEDLGKKIGETTETVTSKAGEMVEIQRLKGQIRTLDEDILGRFGKEDRRNDRDCYE